MSLDNDSILKLVKLTDTNLHVVDIYSEKKRGVVTQIIEATLSYPLSHCPHCHSQNLILNGKRTVNAKLTSINGSPIQLRVHKQRYLCHACGRTCGAQSNNLTFNHTLTHPDPWGRPTDHQAGQAVIGRDNDRHVNRHLKYQRGTHYQRGSTPALSLKRVAGEHVL